MKNIFENNIIEWITNAKNNKNLLIIKDINEKIIGKWKNILIDDEFQNISNLHDDKNVYQIFFKKIKKHLKKDGSLIIAFNNEKIKEFVDIEINNLFDNNLFEEMIKTSGFANIDVYYAYPNYKNIACVYSDEILPDKETFLKQIYVIQDEKMIKLNDYPEYINKLNEDFPNYTFSYIYVLKLQKNKYKKIYTKFSIERDECYKIKTEIIKNKNNKLFIKKSPINKLTKQHIKKMKKTSKRLKPIYKKADLKLNKIKLKNKSAEFEYIDGKTLESLLDEMLLNNDMEQFEEIIKQYIYLIRNKITNLKPFIYNEKFVKIFGNVKFDKNYTSSKINNIDLIFQNIIIKNDIWNIIDYEWVFDFEIPSDFIIYRSLFLYAHNKNSKELHDKLIYELLELNKEEELIFQEMEHNLQLYILGNNKTIDMEYLEYINSL